MGMMAVVRRWLGAQMPGRVEPVSAPMWTFRPESGVWVDHEVALTYGAVFAAVRIIAETLGVLGVHVYERLADGGKRRLDGVPLDQLLRRRWNPYMSAQTGLETCTAHALLWGNGYVEIERDTLRRPVQLWPLLPDRTYPEWRGSELVYRHQPSRGDPVILPASDVVHIRGLGWNGLTGYDMVTYMARSIGGGIAAEKYAGAFFGNGTHLSGGLFHKTTLSPQARENLRQEFERVYAGADKAFRMAVFEEGMEWKQFSVTPEASQLIETRKVNALDVARWFRIPPHKLGDLERATWSNIEHMGIEFVTDTMLPWVVRWEQELDHKLIAQGNRFCKLRVETLLRGDLKSRYEAYRIGREWGWLSANDVREKEDEDRLPADIGDVYMVPANFQAAERLLDQPEPDPGEPPARADDDQGEASDPPPAEVDASVADGVLQAAAARLEAREHHRLRRAFSSDSPAAFYARLTKVMGELAEDAPEILLPPAQVLGRVLGLAEEAVEATVRGVVATHVARRAGAWEQALATGSPPGADTELVRELRQIMVGAAGRGDGRA